MRSRRAIGGSVPLLADGLHVAAVQLLRADHLVAPPLARDLGHDLRLLRLPRGRRLLGFRHAPRQHYLRCGGAPPAAPPWPDNAFLSHESCSWLATPSSKERETSRGSFSSAG